MVNDPESDNPYAAALTDEQLIDNDSRQQLYMPLLTKLDMSQVITANTPTCYSTPEMGNIHQIDTINPTTGFEFSVRKTEQKEIIADGQEYTAYRFWTDSTLPYKATNYSV